MNDLTPIRYAQVAPTNPVQAATRSEEKKSAPEMMSSLITASIPHLCKSVHAAFEALIKSRP